MLKLWPLCLLLLSLTADISDGKCVKRQAPGSVPAASISKRLVCYFASWSIYRSDDQKFSAEDINPNLCTHIIYAFAKVEKNQKGLVPFDPKVDVALDGYKNFIDLKKKNRDLKLLLSAGGSREGSPWFSQIAGDPELRGQFVQNAVRFVREFKFDGLDIAWQWPGLWTGSSSSDRENYALLVKEMREAIIKESEETGNEQLILSIVTPKFEQEIVRGFDLRSMSQYVDFFNIPAYDYHTSSEPTVNHLAPLYNLPGEEYNKEFSLDATVTAYKTMGVDLEKLNVGMPLYGVSFILADESSTDIGAEVDDEGDGVERGALWYNQICKRITEEKWTVKHVNRTAMGPYAYRDVLWVAYDDQESIRNKARYARENGIGGIMFWTIDLDDFHGNCHGRRFPLIKAGLEGFVMSESAPAPIPVKTPIIPLSKSVTLRPIIKLSEVSDSPSTGPVRTEMKVEVDDDDDTIITNLPRGLQVKSQRDVIIQNIKMWVTNYYAPVPGSSESPSSNVPRLPSTSGNLPGLPSSVELGK